MITGQQNIKIGTPNQSAGSDSLYTAFTKTQQNFNVLFSCAISSGSFVSGNGINVTSNATTGITTITNTGVTGIIAGTNITVNQSNGNVTISSLGGGGIPGGSNTQIQFNNDGMFAGNAGFTFDSVHGSLSTTMLNTGEIYNFSGITLENSDLSHGPTAAVLIPNNGNGDIQINNTYGNVEIQTGNSGTINSSWEFNSNGNLTTPGNVIVTGNIIANNIGNVSAINLTGNASQVLYGNGVFGSMPISGTYVLIDEIDINSTTPTVNLIGFNPTLYLNYRVGITGATIDTGSLNFRFSTDNGTTYDSRTLYNWANDLWGSGGYSSYLRAEGDTNVSIVGGISGTPYNAGVEIKIFDPSLSTQYKPFSVDSSFASNDGHSYSYTVKGSYNNISPVNAIQIFNISGNITRGKFRLYGEIK
jgi:hypothetical protein